MDQMRLLLEESAAELRVQDLPQEADRPGAALAQMVLDMHDRTHKGAPIYCAEPACRKALVLRP